MSRRTRTPAPTLSLYSVLKSFKILHRSCCGKGKRAKFYHDRQAKQLLELEIGQEVRMSTLDYAEITRENMVPASRSCQTDHTSHNQVTVQWEETGSFSNLLRHKRSSMLMSINAPAMECNHNEIPWEPVTPEQTPSSGKAAVSLSKSPTVNVEPSVPVAQKTRTSSVTLASSRLADFDMKRWTFCDFTYFFLLLFSFCWFRRLSKFQFMLAPGV